MMAWNQKPARLRSQPYPLLIAVGLLVALSACAAMTPVGAPAPTATPAWSLKAALPRDAILALDHPATVPAGEANAHIGPFETVMGVQMGNEARAYPIGLMNRYEIANDTLGGQPIAVLFCGLCNSGAVVSRQVTDTLGSPLMLTFGVSGQLLDNALVMYDHQTGSLWPLSRLQAIRGPLAETPLKLLAANQMSWDEWVTTHPDTTLVVEERVQPRQAAVALPALPFRDDAPSSTTETVAGYVVGVASQADAQAFPVEAVEAVRVVNAAMEGLEPFVLVALGEPGAIAAWHRTMEGQTLTFQWQEDGLRDEETGSRWDPRTGEALAGPMAGQQLQPLRVLVTHWFGWIDLYPTTQVWNP